MNISFIILYKFKIYFYSFQYIISIRIMNKGERKEIEHKTGNLYIYILFIN